MTTPGTAPPSVPETEQASWLWKWHDRRREERMGDDAGNGTAVGAGVGAAVGDGNDTAVGDEGGTGVGDGSSTVGLPTDIRRVDSARATTPGTAPPSVPGLGLDADAKAGVALRRVPVVKGARFAAELLGIVRRRFRSRRRRWNGRWDRGVG